MAFRSILAFGTLLALVAPTIAHMQMAYPYPINSQHDPQTPDNLKDYSYTSPLNADGSNYPCKGYQKTATFRSTATFNAGGDYNMTLMGSATHGGGSCQISLSYDNGETFKVIKSFIGGCPLTPQLNFSIPTSAPAGQALLAWSWLNYEGNREFYMNCAFIEVAAASSSKRQLNSAKFRRQASTSGSMDDLPYIYRANLASQTDYQTPEDSNTVYPNPGPAVEYSDDATPSDPPASGGNDGATSSSGISGSSDSGSSDPSSSDPSSSDPSSSQGDGTMTLTIAAVSSTTSSSCTSTITSYSTYTMIVSGTSTYSATASATTTTSSAFSPTSTTVSSSIVIAPTSSTSATTTDDGSDSTTSIVIATASTTSAATVTAASTAIPTATTSATSSNSGTFSTANDGACPDGAMGTLKCTNGGQGFSMCNWGQWVDMGSVAAGTECTGPDGSGQIVAADSGDSGSGSSSDAGATTSSTSSSAPASGGYGDSDAGSSSGGYGDSSSGDDADAESETAAPGSCDGAPMGSLKCLSSQDWAMCNWGTWVDMGSVAAGMQCQGPDGSAALVSE